MWDKFKNTTALDLRVIEAVQLVNEEAFESGFTVNHNGEQLQNLARVNMALINTGNTAISQDQIIAQPVISFPDSVSVIAVQVEKQDLKKLESKPKVDRNVITIPLTLLNPDESITLKIYADSGIDELIGPVPISRIKYLDEIEVFNLVDQVESAGVRAATAKIGKLNRDSIKYAFLAIISAFAIFAFSRDFKRQLKLRGRLRDEPDFLDQYENQKELKKFILRNVPVQVRSKGLLNLNEASSVEEIRHAIKDCVKSSLLLKILLFFIVMFLVSGGLAWYYFWQYFRMVLQGYY